MTTKDKALFEVRKHNDFSVLCSDDEDVKEVQQMSSVSAATAAVSVEAVSEASDSAATAGDGFETFSTARKPKRFIHPKSVASAVGSAARPAGKPKEVVVPKAENTVELYEFASTLKTADLRKILNAFDGHYRLKWINDTSCYVVFDEESLVERALNELKDDSIKIKAYVESAVSAEAASASTTTTEAI